MNADNGPRLRRPATGATASTRPRDQQSKCRISVREDDAVEMFLLARDTAALVHAGTRYSHAGYDLRNDPPSIPPTLNRARPARRERPSAAVAAALGVACSPDLPARALPSLSERGSAVSAAQVVLGDHGVRGGLQGPHHPRYQVDRPGRARLAFLPDRGDLEDRGGPSDPFGLPARLYRSVRLRRAGQPPRAALQDPLVPVPAAPVRLAGLAGRNLRSLYRASRAMFGGQRYR